MAEIIVDGGIKGFVTISGALRTALAETTIRVMAGIYRESLVLDKNITIIGVGNREKIVIIGSGKSAISSTAKQVRIQNVTLKQEDSNNPCVDISAGKILIEGCDISGGNNCIAIHGKSASIIRNNRIHEAKYGLLNLKYKIGSGICFYENARGIIEENEIFKNKKHGIYVNSISDSVIRNWLHNNYLSKLGISQSMRNGKFEKNEISLISNVNLMVRNNRIYENEKDGILIAWGLGTGIFEKNEIFQNKMSGIYATSYTELTHSNIDSDIDFNADLIVRSNQIHENEKNGISISRINNLDGDFDETDFLRISSKVTFEENKIFKNKKNSLYVHSFVLLGADLMVRSNQIHKNNLNGVLINSGGTFEKNKIFKNKKMVFI